LSHREPDRVPRGDGLTQAVVEEFRRRTGEDDPGKYWDWDIPDSVRFLPPEPLPDLDAIFARFYEHLDYEWAFDWSDYPPEWGVATRPAHFYHFSAPIAPMARFSSVAELKEYPFPDYLGDWRHDHLEGDVRRLKAEGYPADGWIGWIFQTAWSMRGREQLFFDFHDNPDFAAYLLDRISEIRAEQATRLAESGVDTVSFNDDIGTQRSMIMSLEMWRKWLKPRMAAVIQAAKRVNPRIYFRYHSDGMITPLIPDLIEIGVDSLITVQPESMDIYDIKRRFGEEICMEGTIGCQSELMRGTSDEVRAMVKGQCEGLMTGGGFVASPANAVEPDVPFENLVALHEALDEHGWY
jgi:uroporphyrinogen decarboxylase